MVIKIYGHGGQGIDTTRKIIGKAMLLSGFYAQDFIISGLERRPDKVYGFVKFDKKPILSKQIERPDIVLVFDSDMINEAKEIKENGIALFNITEKINLSYMKEKKVKTFSIDANSIVFGLTKKPIPNIAMLGAFTKIFDKISIKNMKFAIQEELGDARENLIIFDEGYKNVKKC
ncbi:MAG: 2-oxoacid:acceptor oxidoreductase family protein [Candidatus Aenigmatarchaeota archaeon]